MRIKKQINIEIGEEVRKAREQACLTQEQLAEVIDVSPQFVSDMERGVVGISLITLKKICISLGISSDQLLFGKHEIAVGDVIWRKCEKLSDRQISFLLNIVDCYISAIEP